MKTKPSKEVFKALQDIQKRMMICNDLTQMLQQSVNSDDELFDGQTDLLDHMRDKLFVADELEIICASMGVNYSDLYHKKLDGEDEANSDQSEDTTDKPLHDALPVLENNIPKAKRLELAGIASRHIRLLLCSIGEKDTVSEYVGLTLVKIEEELGQLDCMLGVNDYAEEEAEVTA